MKLLDIWIYLLICCHHLACAIRVLLPARKINDLIILAMPLLERLLLPGSRGTAPSRPAGVGGGVGGWDVKVLIEKRQSFNRIEFLHAARRQDPRRDEVSN